MSSSTTSPLVSVIIPAYNAAAFIDKTLQSALKQTHTHIEVLVIDDGSEDETPSIVQFYAERDCRVRLLRQANQGVASARNLGIQNAKGQFIAPLDADDIWLPQNLEKKLEQFAEHPLSVGVVYSWSFDIDKTDNSTGAFCASSIEGKVHKTLLCHYFLGNASASLIRRECFDEVGHYDNQFLSQGAQGCEDWDLYLRIAENYQFRVVPIFLVGYRKTAESMSTDFNRMANSHSIMISKMMMRHPEISRLAYRLSSSSLYLYFARQNEALKNYSRSLFWLWRAFQVDPLTPLWRPGFYFVLLKSIAKLGIQVMVSDNSFSGDIHRQPWKDIAPTNKIRTLTVQPINLWFKLRVSYLLHRSLSVL
ncbi:glycosyltransferase family 2 protein [Pseudanabaena sp. FACHB-2040]|nr:glycosyltransferase family 2 protein [Pseudanabaena sp. FACHB-2040]